MNIRSGAGMMDFEYDNKTGPVDRNSPFLRHAVQSGHYEQEHTLQSMDSLAKKRMGFDALQNGHVLTSTGPHSVLDSPNKTSTFPSLRDPTPHSTFLFSRPLSKELPSAQLSNNPAFNTPRTKSEANYDSSEVDASSPDYNADSDATPDKMGFRFGISKTSNALTRLLTPEKRNPALVRLNGYIGRSENVRANYSQHAENKIRKKRSKVSDRVLARRKPSSSSGSGDDTGVKEVPAGPGVIASIFSFIENHPGLPHILSFYAQLLLNVFLVFFFIYLTYSFWATIRADVDKKAEEAMIVIRAEMALCAQRYGDNRCGGDARMPALESLCNEWDRCANQDPRAVGRARVSAHTFAEIFNSFVEPISWKAMIFTFFLVFGCVGISNFAFSFFRNKGHLPIPQPTPAHYYMPTPQRHPSEPQDYDQALFQSPRARYVNPATGGMLENESPTRRLQR